MITDGEKNKPDVENSRHSSAATQLAVHVGFF